MGTASLKFYLHLQKSLIGMPWYSFAYFPGKTLYRHRAGMEVKGSREGRIGTFAGVCR
jgi:hypothetical protein